MQKKLPTYANNIIGMVLTQFLVLIFLDYNQILAIIGYTAHKFPTQKEGLPLGSSGFNAVESLASCLLIVDYILLYPISLLVTSVLCNIFLSTSAVGCELRQKVEWHWQWVAINNHVHLEDRHEGTWTDLDKEHVSLPLYSHFWIST
jgi:hypothetical protein